MARAQALRVGEAVSLETTPLDPVDRGEFDAFVYRVEPMVRRSLVAIHGPEVGRAAALDALTWAWQNWDRAADWRSPAAHLVHLASVIVRSGADRGAIVRRQRSDAAQEELTRAFTGAFDLATAEALGGLSEHDRAALLLMHGSGVTPTDMARVLRTSRSATRRGGERSLEILRSVLRDTSTLDAETVLVDGMARLDELASTIPPPEVVEHANRVGHLASMDDVDDEQPRRHVVIGMLVVVAVLAAVVWWPGGQRRDATATAPTTTDATGPADASAFTPTGIAAQPELTVYPILADLPEGYRLIDRSLTLDPSQRFGQVITGLLRNDPEPWRRRLWLFAPNGSAVASIATFDGDSIGGSDFARTVHIGGDIGGVSVEIGQDASDRFQWWAMVHGVTAGLSTTGAVYIGGVTDEATVRRIATEVAVLDPRSAQFAVSLATDLGPGWQTYREPRTVDIAAARYLRDDGWSSLYVSSFAAPVQSNFDLIYPAADPSIVIRQIDGPMFVSVAAVPPGSVDAFTMNRIADSVELVRRDAWDWHAVEAIPTTTEPTGDLLPTGLTSTEGGPITVGIPNGQLCIRVGKSPNPIRASGTTCIHLRGQTSSSTAAIVMLGAVLDQPPPERFVAGATTTDASHIRFSVIDVDGVSTTAESSLIRDPSLGPALWAVRIPPAGHLQSVEYLDDAGKVLDHLGPTG